MKYGSKPKELGVFQIQVQEMMFYQYLPIKMPFGMLCAEDRLNVFYDLVREITSDFANTYGNTQFVESYIYLTAKHLYQTKGRPFNREGWHSDGFMTNDINYVWSDRFPTVFNSSEFHLTMDDQLSLKEMEEQADPVNNFTYPDGTLLRLDQYNIHRVGDITESGMRTFLKVSFSKDKYDLIGNSHNYLLDYDWEMKPRNVERNIPQSNLKATK